MSFENEFLVTFTFGLGEFESVCIPLLFTGCECQKRISYGTEKKVAFDVFAVQRVKKTGIYLLCSRHAK